MSLLAASFVAPRLALGAVPLRLAAVDWAMLETAIALGNTPVAACEVKGFRRDAVTPVLPPDIVDLGLRGAPNFELMQIVRPDLILSSPYYVRHLARMEPIAPVLTLPFFVPGEAPLPKAMAALTELGARIGADPAPALAAAEAEFAAARDRLAPVADRPVYLVNIGDSRHFRAFGADSLFGNVLERAGLTNAWADRTRFAFTASVPIEALAARPEARIVVIGAPPVQTEAELRRSVLWNHLPAVAERRLHRLPEISPFGGILAARRFATELVHALGAA
ncbi:ABC transporter substrate-binding protein [Falsirhodobacter sp. 20TX0035]|nr:ABC transporter substrate-binding protein [Falsirhodobacter sp. 20TX0035]MDB6454978.1 ABC transporter substrate-binding protein [Falsirhodobacter sp. 20TX0035]